MAKGSCPLHERCGFESRSGLKVFTLLYPNPYNDTRLQHLLAASLAFPMHFHVLWSKVVQLPTANQPRLADAFPSCLGSRLHQPVHTQPQMQRCQLPNWLVVVHDEFLCQSTRSVEQRLEYLHCLYVAFFHYVGSSVMPPSTRAMRS